MTNEISSIDCRGKIVPEVGAAILSTFNALDHGEQFDATVDAFGSGLRMWMLEAGARYEILDSQVDSIQLRFTRGQTLAQGTVPGLHDLHVGSDGRVWACERAEHLACFDGASGELIKSAAVASHASHIGIDKDETTIFVADVEANELIAVASESLEVLHRWAAPGKPQIPLVTDDGIICMTGGGSGTLLIVRPTSSDYENQVIKIGSTPHDPVASKDGKYLFAPCAGDGEIVKVRLSNGNITGRFKVGDGPGHLSFSPDGTRLYSANSFDGSLDCMSPEGDNLGRVQSGDGAHYPIVTPDGRHVLVANFLSDTVTVFDAISLELITTLETDPYPHGLDISADGKWIVATGFSSEYVRVIEGETFTETARVKVGAGSSHSAFMPDNQAAWTACSVSNHLAKIDLATGENVYIANINHPD